MIIEKYLPKYHDAYNVLEYESTRIPKQGMYYLLNAQASLYSIHYVKTMYTSLSEVSQFKKFLDIIHLNLGFIDSVIYEITKYAFAEPNYLNYDFRIILRNFLKRGDMKKNSLNAAYDLFFLHTIRAVHNQELENFNGKIDSWCMTADNGISSLSRLVTFSDSELPFIIVHNNNLDKIKLYLESCDHYYRQVNFQRSVDTVIQKGIVDIDSIIEKAENHIKKIDAALA